MAYQVLARKWRPKTFADLVGQEHVVKALQNALDKGRLHHAYLLTGTRGVGKTTIARILAKSLNCETPQQGEPCGHCRNCQDIDQGRFVDLIEIDAASNTGIDNIREVLENAQYAPTAGKYKVYIIDEVHMLSKSAFNAMLKTLEEPPEHVKFILATTDPHKVPITVLSRCLQFVLRNMTAQQVSEHLAHVLAHENIPHQSHALTLLGRAAAGSMRDALSLLDQAIAMGSGSVNEQDVREMIGAADKRYLYEMLLLLAQKNGTAMLDKAREMAANAVGFDSALNDLALLLQRVALLQTVPDALAPEDPERDTLAALAQQFSGEQIQLYYQCLIHGKRDLPLAPDEYAGFVMTLLRMLAFAPLAATQVAPNSQISGSQLHTPDASATPAAHTANDNTPPKPQLPEPPRHTEVPPAVQAASPTPVVETPVVPETLVITETPVAPETPATPTTLAPSEPQAADNTPPWQNDSVTPAATEQIVAEQTIAETPAAPVPQNTAADTDTASAAEHPLTLPALCEANWLDIAAQIGKHISAAQLVLQHLGWAGFDEEGGVLTLALIQENTHTIVSKEYFERISAVLSEAYRRPITLRTQAWQSGLHSETPQMHRARLLKEAHEQAVAALDNDPTVHALKELFHAKWLDDSISLINPQS